ncbi:MAG: hypothetical protein NVSMB24_23550 [Mucilaginibacter sp.]
MQKIDFVKNLEVIVEKLQSEKIIALFDNGFRIPNNPYSFELINPLLFQSKSNFDQIKNNVQMSQILIGLNAEELYSESNLAQLTTILRPTPAAHIVIHAIPVSFYSFHKSLLLTAKLAKEVLLSEILNEGFDETLNRGILIFQVVIDNEGLETERYIKIFSALNELVETISKVVEETEKSEVVLLDSGSDTNVGIKAGVETAKSLFLVFKEIWDYIVSFRHYRQNVDNKSLLDSLSIREEIQKKVSAGIISEAEGKEYSHMIKSRTDELIGMKVMPKQIVIESTEIQNKKLLSDFEGYKMLGQRD